jgi:hypothetical protein
MELGMYIMAPEPESTAYFIIHCDQVIMPIVARQRLGKSVIAAKNTHATKEELLEACFSMQPVSNQRKLGY